MDKRENRNGKRYDTAEKKLKFLTKKGNIITFKEPFFPWGTANESRRQIIVIRIARQQGSVKIEGRSYDSKWFANMEALTDAIDWQWMEDMHEML